MTRATRLHLVLTTLATLAVGCGGVDDSGGAASGNLDGSTPTTPHDFAVAAPTTPFGNWKVKTAADGAAAGFQTITFVAGGSWTETGRSDDQPQTGNNTRPGSIDIDASCGQPPAGMHGPYVEVDNNPNGDGEWVYGWTESANRSSLTLTLYAQRFGMGLRWATPTSINLVAEYARA